LTAGRKGTPQVPSLQRGENGRAEKTRERGAKKTGRGGDKAERRRLPERFGQTLKGAKGTISLAQAKDTVPGPNCMLKSLWG